MASDRDHDAAEILDLDRDVEAAFGAFLNRRWIDARPITRAAFMEVREPYLAFKALYVRELRALLPPTSRRDAALAPQTRAAAAAAIGVAERGSK